MGCADFLLGSKGFKDLIQSDIDALNTVCSEETFKSGDTIFPEEGPGDKMYIIKSGSIKITKKVKGQENTLAVINAGEFIGEMALLDGLPRSAGAKAAADTVVVSISRDNYQALRQKYPQTALKIMDILVKVLSNRLRQANKNLEVISFWIE
ncbi:MAG TPA: cyclic nucleotide-binding domain-containing protein [Candidatus Goldiibacteriota bacterium]|nr:cyclic nucleotide-binding domain-containing protein [Candidatus Goldiibacteriota bacterium]